MLFVLDDVCTRSLARICLKLMHRFSRLLVRHPDTMHRLRKEVYSVMGKSDQPAREHIRRMPFLASVIKESKLSKST